MKAGPLLKKRSLAFMFDLILVKVLHVSLFTTYMLFIDSFLPQLSAKAQMLFLEHVVLVDSLSFVFILFGHFFFWYEVCKGQTPGKFLFGLKSNPLDKTRQWGTRESLLKTLGDLSGVLSFFTLFLVNFIRQDGKGISDLLSQTEVTEVHSHSGSNIIRLGHTQDEEDSTPFYPPLALVTKTGKSEDEEGGKKAA